MRRSLIAIGLTLMMVTTGCLGLGSVNPAEVPSQDAQDQGWEKTEETADSYAMGLGERAEKRYQPQDNPNRGAVSVNTANDIPFFDESELLPRAIDRMEERYNIELNKTGTRSVELANMEGAVTADEYTMENGPAEGKAITFTAPCDPFVAVIAFGTTPDDGGDDGGILGGSSSTTQTNYYEESVEVARHVTC